MSISVSKMTVFCFSIFLFLAMPTMAETENTLAAVIDGQHRSDQNRARDQYRHPQQTLSFMGIEPSMSVIEIWPGKGWYSEILAPWLKQGGGQFIAAGFPQHAGPKWRQKMQQDYQAWLTASPELYDEVQIVEIGPPEMWSLGEDSSVDAVLTFRNVHNWVKGGYEQTMFEAMYRVLKTGGILGVVDHRAKKGTDLEIMNKSGYLTEDLVINLAKKAGFSFKAKSEVNANLLDGTDHPKGVWTLPPMLRLGDEKKDKYLAIGESDRFTLIFKKQ
jgi:predicted methyltransferase